MLRPRWEQRRVEKNLDAGCIVKEEPVGSTEGLMWAMTEREGLRMALICLRNGKMVYGFPDIGKGQI